MRTKQAWDRYFGLVGWLLVVSTPLLYMGAAAALFPASVLARVLFSSAHGLLGAALLMARRGRPQRGLALMLIAMMVAVSTLLYTAWG